MRKAKHYKKEIEFKVGEVSADALSKFADTEFLIQKPQVLTHTAFELKTQ